MLPDPTVPPSLLGLLAKLGTFTAPSPRTFAALVTGLVAQTGKRTVTGMLTGAGLANVAAADEDLPADIVTALRTLFAERIAGDPLPW